eukprot:7380363-Prymnesium_polylepis.2
MLEREAHRVRVPLVPMMTGLASEFLTDAAGSTLLNNEGWVLHNVDDVRTKVVRAAWDRASAASVFASPRHVLRACAGAKSLDILDKLTANMAEHHKAEVMLMK